MQILNLSRPLVVFDTETTSLDVLTARIVEIGFQLYEGFFPGDGPKKEWRSYVNPLMPIPEASTKVHHITDAIVQGCRDCGQSR